MLSEGEAPELRPAIDGDAAAIARIWHDGWQEGHLGHVPAALVQARTPASFGVRASQRVHDTTVAVSNGEVAGFVMVVADEVEQVYVGSGYRGTGIASALLAHAESLVATAGHDEAWLAVVAGNSRARRFYERQGWADEGPFDYVAATADGPIVVPAHRYTKPVAAAVDATVNVE